MERKTNYDLVIIQNVDIGASGTAGTLDIFPSTASKGKFTFTCVDQTGDTAVTLEANAMGQATKVNIADPGAAASYIVQSTAALTLAEVDVLDGVTPGTAAASKAIVLDGSLDITGINDLSLAGLTSSDITASRAVVSSGASKLAASAVTSTELGYVSGVTSAIQTQLDAKPDAINDLSDVTITSAAVDEILTYNGALWINKAAAGVGAGSGISFYMDDTSIIGTGANNDNELNELFQEPQGGAEDVDTISCATNTVLGEGYLYDTALGGSSIAGGDWVFKTYCSVSSITAGRVSSLLRNIYLTEVGSGTLTITGSGTTRTATASSGTPFAADDDNADITLCGYIQTPLGLYAIPAYTSPTVVSITTPSGYSNESAVAYTVWKYQFGSSTGAITTLTTNYGLITHTSVQSSIGINATDKLAEIVFGTSNNTTDVNFTHNGTEHYSNFASPIGQRHNDLAGLNGGTSGEYYHMTSSEHTDATGVATTGHDGLLLTLSNNAAQYMNGVGAWSVPAGGGDVVGPGTHATGYVPVWDGVDSNTLAEGFGFGIADNKVVQIDSASVADDEYARFTANGLESRTPAELLSDLTLPCEIGMAISDETSTLTTGTAKITFRMPFAMTLTEVRANVVTAPTGSVLTVDINESGTTVLSTKITIDATEKTSETAATPPVISDSALADDAEMTVDIDGVGSTIAGAGLKIWLIGTKA